ncbi:MAG: hypothetical protein K9L68_14075 [Spirochaetales bacterium]|nr:hypothetical protein [Spirochaetales bacterium]MCF7939721.1 hypothetical protein [Spirochaetales bacterium]
MKPKERVIKRVKDDDAYYEIIWSKLFKTDKYQITTEVPSVSGLIELFYQQPGGRMALFFLALVWYGGVREEIRKLTDPVLEEDDARREILEKYDIYYRFAQVESFPDLKDILFFFKEELEYPNESIEHSGRYERIFVLEKSRENLPTTMEPLRPMN